MLGTVLHMMQGTPYIYQGEELGMTNVFFDSVDDYNDLESMILGVNTWWSPSGLAPRICCGTSVLRVGIMREPPCSGMRATMRALRPAPRG